MTNSFKSKLSRRLSFFTHYYGEQSQLWDIGCDHGHLGLWFLDHPATPAIHLVDPAGPVISKLQERVKASDIPRVTLYHQRGQDIKLKTDTNNFIFIAGMGGIEIIEILKNLIPQLAAKDQILISPHTKVLEVRAFLRETGPLLLKESVIFESGIWYPHFLLGPGGRECSPFGDEIFQGEEGGDYRQHLMSRLSGHRDSQSKEFLNFLKGL